MAKLGLVRRNRKKISQIINAYLYLSFFLLIILWQWCIRKEKKGSPCSPAMDVVFFPAVLGGGGGHQ
jgi:hypothetical protein